VAGGVAQDGLEVGLSEVLAGVAALCSPTNIFQWDSRASALPFASIGQAPRLADAEGTLTALTQPDFSPHQFVYLSTNALSFITATNSPDAKIVSQIFSAHRIDLEIMNSTPAMLHLSQSYYHPWHAYIDDRSATIWRANHAFQAVEIPAGQHRVRFVYEDRLFRYGTITSLATLFACALLWRRAGRPSIGTPIS